MILALVSFVAIAAAPATAQHQVAPPRPTAVPAKPTVVPPAARRSRPVSAKSAAHAVEKIVVALGAHHEHSSPLHNLPAGKTPAPVPPASPQRIVVHPAARPPAASAAVEPALSPQLPRRPVPWPAREVAVQWPPPPKRVEIDWPADQARPVTLRWNAATILSELPAEPASLDR